MSLARRAVLAASRTKPVFATQTRAASSSSHDHHDDHHHHQEDSTVYPAESFGNAFWRNVLLISLGTAAVIKLAPVAADDVYLTRWMAMYATPGSYWLGLNAKHTIQQETVARENMLLNDASLPAVTRFTYPQAMRQASPFLNGIGMNVDMTGVVPKQGHETV
ncbi:hypothetical protein HYPSUDRAFT_34928 [Hypholoma sublateritium FD-334 SS-4]|uniref:Uncharacterized protein n=1 Tax=Hypholoma sublateritium (strain FD-334 SS-4) TaxID=945553 RepID=A0A0D2LJE8_HYPSF|nr:hypothetical protein HYPSUDRAFT_34928 [Hypholoma sublateritium FD-334 SS-4]